MINAYCDGLSGTFAQLVYYGVLKDEDAQCFRVDTSIANGFYVLAAGAILLAFLNAFVMKAVRQYDRDKESVASSSEIPSKLGSNEDDLEHMRSKIHPVPVLFSDTFRWLLQGENARFEEGPCSMNSTAESQKSM
jgi:hypothetical protein